LKATSDIGLSVTNAVRTTVDGVVG
jgi:hypothetical protein